MPWQSMVSDVAMELDDNGKLVYHTVIITVPRQSGKTSLQLAVMSHRCLAFPAPQRVAFAAQNGVAARDKLLDDWSPVLHASALASLVNVRRQSGHEAIEWNNGSRVVLAASTEKSGHGQTLDVGVIDEAFAQEDARLEQAFRPAMSTRDQTQLWITSTAGSDSDEYFKSKVKLGRKAVESGSTSGVAYFEWSFADGDDPSDPATWWKAMPALGITITEDKVRESFESMDEREFLRAYGNVWVGRQKTPPVIDLDLYDGLEDVRSHAEDLVVFAVAVSTDRTKSSIGMAGRRDDGLVHVEEIQTQPGTDWVVARLVELNEKWSPAAIVIDGGGPAAPLVPDIEAADLKPLILGSRDVISATARFYDSIVNGAIRHTEQPDLRAAVAGARKKNAGEGWVWDRRNSSGDITPLEAVTLAAFGLDTAPAPVKPWVEFL